MTEYRAQDAGENSLWDATAVEDTVSEPISGNHKADVLVVGGGYSGLSTALHLAEKGVSVVLLEAKSIGFGGSGRNAGLVNAGIWQSPNYVVSQLGEEAGQRFNQALFDSPSKVFELIEHHKINCQAEQVGTINVAHSGSSLPYLQDRFEQLQKLGASVSLIDGTQSQKMSGSAYYGHGGIFDSKAGTIQPIEYVRGLAEAAINQGAKIYPLSPLLSLVRQDTKWLAKSTNGQVVADKVVLATNAYADQNCESVDESTLPVFIFQCATEPLKAEVAESIIPERQGLWDTQTLLTSSRIDSDGRLIMSSAGSLRGISKSIRQNWLKRLRNRIYPQASDANWAHHWTGQIGVTSTKLPRVQLLAPGVFAPAGYNGRGIGTGTMMGKYLADTIISGNRNEFPFPVEALYREKQRKLRTAYYECATLALQCVDRR